MEVTDRLKKLLAQSRLTGLDFVAVQPGQVTLLVYFLRSPASLDHPLTADLSPQQVRIYYQTTGGRKVFMPVKKIQWLPPASPQILRITTPYPGEFTQYTLFIDDSRIDPFFNGISFSFKALCPTQVDCRTALPSCPEQPGENPEIQYQARDFWSLRRALTDFASLRFPEWQDRLAADAGMLLLELFSALGDEFAYFQDRVAREAYLKTATQRRSLEMHARLLDYHADHGHGGSTWLDIQVLPGQQGNIPAGSDVWALSDNQAPIYFELGRGLKDMLAQRLFSVNSACNSFTPHIWDEQETCLKTGATTLHIKGHHQGILAFDDPPEDPRGKWVLLSCSPADPSLPQRRHLVRLVDVREHDSYGQPLKDPLTGEDLTLLSWEQSEALPFDMELKETEVHANLVPAVSGRSVVCYFSLGIDPQQIPSLPEKERGKISRALERESAAGTVSYLCPLLETEKNPLVWLQAEGKEAFPEIQAVPVVYQAGAWKPVESPWQWRPSFLGLSPSKPLDADFIVEAGIWKRVSGYRQGAKELVHEDYATDSGHTLRFGDGSFGRLPRKGVVFQISLRTGQGSVYNLPASALTQFDSTLSFIRTVTNPLAVTNSRDAESNENLAQQAPYAFRALSYRAVRPEDYAQAARTLPWVSQAGAVFRWTGSWQTVFVAPDPQRSFSLTKAQQRELLARLDAFRQAGREVQVAEPCYADINLRIVLCVAPHAYAAEVKQRVEKALLPPHGFFSADRFSFGDPLERSRLEAFLQGVAGVRMVKRIDIQRAGYFPWRVLSELQFPVAMHEILRIENNALYPQRGSVELIMEGGA